MSLHERKLILYSSICFISLLILSTWVSAKRCNTGESGKSCGKKGCPPARPGCKPHKQAKIQGQSLQGNCIRWAPPGPPPTTKKPTTTTKEPDKTTTPTPAPTCKVNRFVCRSQGFFPDPGDCQIYYNCIYVGYGYMQQEFNCGYGMHWGTWYCEMGRCPKICEYYD